MRELYWKGYRKLQQECMGQIGFLNQGIQFLA